MDEYLAWLLELTHWHWLAFGIALGGVEMLSASFFLIFPAISAGLVALVVLIEPELDWRLQVLIFSVLSVLSTVIGRAWLNRIRATGAPMTINVRGQNYAGRRIRLQETFEQGQGRLQIDGIWWRAAGAGPETIPVGTLVEVIEADGATLLIRTLDD